MSIQIVYHGIMAEAAGIRKENLEHVNTVGMLKNVIRTRHRDVKNFFHIMAVNGHIAEDERKLKRGDVIDIIPPLPGG